MPSKLLGRTCSACAGDCCIGIIFHVPPGTEHNVAIDMSHRELKQITERWERDPNGTRCGSKTPEGCGIYATRPRLCKTYYCGGRYWRQKN